MDIKTILPYAALAVVGMVFSSFSSIKRQIRKDLAYTLAHAFEPYSRQDPRKALFRLSAQQKQMLKGRMLAPDCPAGATPAGECQVTSITYWLFKGRATARLRYEATEGSGETVEWAIAYWFDHETSKWILTQLDALNGPSA